MLNTRYKILLTWVLLVAFVPAFGQTKIQSTCLDGTSIVDPDIIDFSYEIALAEMRGVNHHYHDSILVPQAFVDSIKSYVSAYHNATELSGSIMDYREFRYYNQEFGEILLTFDANSNCFYRQDGELIITNDTLTHYIDSLKLFAQSWSDTEISLSDTSSTINFYGDFNLFYDISGISKVDLILLCPDMLPCYKSRSGNFKDNTLKIILSDVNECDTNYYHHNWIYTVNSDCQIEINSQTSFSPIGAEWYYNCNGNWYTVLPEDYMPLVEMGKRWNTLRLIPGPENTHPTHIEYSIESEQLHDFCWNGKKYYELKGKYIAHGDDVNPSDTATNYIREENGKVFLLDPNQLYTEDCKEALLYDFSAKIADTLTLGFDSIRYLVVPTETPTIQGRRIIALADLTEPELSNLAVWIEGVGDTRGLLMSKESLYIDGVINVLTCCHMDDNLIYQDSNYPDCGWPASLNKIISKHINIYPNPANNTIIIDGVSGKRLIYQIVNSAGLVVKEGKLVHTMELNLSDGVYLLLIKEKNKIVVAEKLIINHP